MEWKFRKLCWISTIICKPVTKSYIYTNWKLTSAQEVIYTTEIQTLNMCSHQFILVEDNVNMNYHMAVISFSLCCQWCCYVSNSSRWLQYWTHPYIVTKMFVSHTINDVCYSCYDNPLEKMWCLHLWDTNIMYYLQS